MNENHKTIYMQQKTYQTKDGSMIRELMHPSVHAELGVSKQSLAEATMPPGVQTAIHKHQLTEELYYIIAGKGLMRLGSDEFEVEAGDTVCIPPGTGHCISAIGCDELRFLCSCSPAYAHDDTELL